MKAYVGFKKDKSGKVRFGLSVYSDIGVLLYSAVTTQLSKSSKFSNTLDSLAWAVKKFNPTIMSGVLPSDEKILLFISNAVLYDWCALEYVSQPYTETHSDMLLSFSALYNEVEIIYSKTADSKVTFKSFGTDSQQAESATSFFDSLE